MTILTAGDIAVVGYHHLSPDGFAMVLLTDVNTSDAIRFTERGWTDVDTTSFGSPNPESDYSWTPPSNLAAGTIVTFSETATNGTLNVFINGSFSTTISGASGSTLALGSSGDQIFVYQGSLTSSPTLIYGHHLSEGDLNTDPDGTWDDVPVDSGTQSDRPDQLNPALNGGIDASLGHYNGDIAADVGSIGEYTGTTTGSKTALLAAITDPTNWTYTDTVTAAIGANPYSLAPFTVSAATAAPTLDTNTSSNLNEGGTDIVDASELETNDADTVDAALTYTLDTTVANGTLYIDNDGSNTLTGGDTVLGVGGTFTQQTIANGDLQYEHNAGETTSDNFQFDVSDGTVSIDNQTFTFTIAAVNDLPVIGNVDGDIVTFTEGDTNLQIDNGGNATVTDADDADLNGGSITVSFSANGQVEDQLQIENQGFSAGQVAIAGSNVFFSGSIVGTFAGGINGAALTVTFIAAAATTAAAAAIISALQYNNSAGDNPNGTARTIDVVVSDGSANSTTSQITLNVTAVDDPAVAIDDAFATTEDAALAGLNVLAANPTTADSDPDTALTVTQVNGVGGDVGNSVTLASGALLQVNANGTFTYDPNGAFESVANGASTTDSFTYQLNGDDTATATVTINGVDNDDTLIATLPVEAHDGGAGNNTVSFENAAFIGVIANLGTNTTTGDDIGNGDTFTNIQNLSGTDFGDTLTGDGGANILEGGLGDDVLDGAAGNDTASFAGFSGPVNVNLNIATPQATGAGNDTLSNIENLTGGIGDDRLVGATGANGTNVLNGRAGSDDLFGIGGDDTLNGGSGNDKALGGAGADILNGDDGDDLLKGGSGDDVITGGVGRDVLFGEAGADIFTFNDISETGLLNANRDVIRDFNAADGDQIDLSGIDAITGGADDAFTFLGTFPNSIPAVPFTTTSGELFAVNTAGGQTVVWGDVNGDGVQDFTFVLDGTLALVAGDFIL